METDDTTEELLLAGPPALDPIGREIARMKVGDALFAKRLDEVPRPTPRAQAKSRWYVWVVAALVVVAAVLAIVMQAS